MSSWSVDLFNYKKEKTKLWSNFLVQTNNEAVSVERMVSKVKIHVMYNDVTTDYDIALIKLDRPVSIGNTIFFIIISKKRIKSWWLRICKVVNRHSKARVHN